METKQKKNEQWQSFPKLYNIELAHYQNTKIISVLFFVMQLDPHL